MCCDCLIRSNNVFSPEQNKPLLVLLVHSWKVFETIRPDILEKKISPVTAGRLSKCKLFFFFFFLCCCCRLPHIVSVLCQAMSKEQFKGTDKLN